MLLPPINRLQKDSPVGGMEKSRPLSSELNASSRLHSNHGTFIAGSCSRTAPEQASCTSPYSLCDSQCQLCWKLHSQPGLNGSLNCSSFVRRAFPSATIWKSFSQIERLSISVRGDSGCLHSVQERVWFQREGEFCSIVNGLLEWFGCMVNCNKSARALATTGGASGIVLLIRIQLTLANECHSHDCKAFPLLPSSNSLVVCDWVSKRHVVIEWGIVTLYKTCGFLVHWRHNTCAFTPLQYLIYLWDWIQVFEFWPPLNSSQNCSIWASNAIVVAKIEIPVPFTQKIEKLQKIWKVEHF